MKSILVVSYLPIHPANSGGRVRIRQLATNLARGHRVTVVCPPLESTPAEQFPFELVETSTAGARQLFDPRAYTDIISAARQANPDYILLEYIWQGMHAALASFALGVPVVLDAFDVVTLRLRSAGAALWPLASAYERLVLRMPERVFAVSDIDRRHLVELGAPMDRTSIVPNGVDTQAFRPNATARERVRTDLNISSGERMILFFGQLGYQPNAEAVRLLVQEVAPRLHGNFRIFVAGPGEPPLVPDECVTFLGSVNPLPDYINAADAVVAPIMSGSGTRIKLLESIACGTPTVCTTRAAEGLDAEACGPALSICDGWEEFTSAVNDASGRGNIPPATTFRQRYDWRHIVERIDLN